MELIRKVSKLHDNYLTETAHDIEFHLMCKDGQVCVAPGHLNTLTRLCDKKFEVEDEPWTYGDGKSGIVRINVPGDMELGLRFLKFVYTGNISYDYDTLVGLLRMADSLEVATLREKCGKTILDQLHPRNVCSFYISVMNLVSADVKDEIHALMLRCAFYIFHYNLHLRLPEDSMIWLLQSDQLNVLGEEQVMSAVWDWGLFNRTDKAQHATVDEIERVTAKILDFVRWSLISYDIDLPWKKFLDERNSKEKATTPRHCDNRLSIIKFFQVLNFRSSPADYYSIDENLKVCECWTSWHSMMDLVTLSFKTDMYLTGLCFDIIGITHDFDFPTPNVCVDFKSTDGNYRSDDTLLFKSPSTPFYIRQITMEFSRPILLSGSGSSHTISLSARDCRRYKDIEFPIFWPNIANPLFSVVTNVARSISAIYYVELS